MGREREEAAAAGLLTDPSSAAVNQSADTTVVCSNASHSRIEPAEVPGVSQIEAPLIESFPAPAAFTVPATNAQAALDSPFGGAPLGLGAAVSPRDLMDATSAPTGKVGNAWFCSVCNCK